jgi:hypothetical protein
MSGQAAFRAALLDANLPEPDGLTDGADAPAGARFSVYRNNVVVSLKDAMKTAFPLVAKLLGPENFDRLSGHFVRAHPPTSPLMMHYGAAFPAFLEAFEPLRHLGYLPDCARLDLALRQSYHAADSTPLDPALLADTGTLEDLRLALAPSSRVLRSVWPLFDLWAYNMRPNQPKPQATAQDVLVTRPGFDPAPHLLPPGAAIWLGRLAEGAAFGQAAEETARACPAFDLAQALSLALQTSALIRPD